MVTVAFVTSTVTLTSRDSPGSSVKDAASSVTFCPVFAATVSVNGSRAARRLVMRTGRVAVHVACDGESRPSDSAVGSASIVASPALSTSTRPLPVAMTSLLMALAVAMSAALMRAGDQSRWMARSSAAAPATCGVAIDVPLSEP